MGFFQLCVCFDLFFYSGSVFVRRQGAVLVVMAHRLLTCDEVADACPIQVTPSAARQAAASYPNDLERVVAWACAEQLSPKQNSDAGQQRFMEDLQTHHATSGDVGEKSQDVLTALGKYQPPRRIPPFWGKVFLKSVDG